MIRFLLEVVIFVAILAWLGAGVWFLSGGSLQLTALIGLGLMLALGYALDKIIPERRPHKQQQPAKSPEVTEEKTTAAPAPPKDNHRPESLLLDIDGDAESFRRWMESFDPPESWKPPAPIEAQEVERMREAADQGDAETQTLLACMYDPFIDNSGKNLPKDDRQAATWYRRAAEQGHSFAQLRLGEKYRDGQGVLQDFVKAHAWMNLAALGDPVGLAPAWLKSLQERMVPEQVAQAHRLAAEIRERIESLKSR